VTYPQPAAAGRNRLLIIVLSSVLGVAVLCCGGLWALGTFGPDATKNAASTAPALAVPSSIPVAIPTVATSGASVAPARTTAVPHPTSRKPAPKATPKPKPTTHKPAKPTPTTAPTRQGVHPGAFCSPAGALGRTSAGTLMKCKTTATDDRNRWRKA